MGSQASTGRAKAASSTPKQSPKASITGSDKAKLQLKMQRDNLIAAIQKYERIGDTEHARAMEFYKAGNKRKALYCLKREKIQQAQIQSVTEILDNVQKLINSVEFAQIELEVTTALRDGKGELAKLNKMLNIDDIESLMNETAESVDEARRIDAILNQPINGVKDTEEDLLKELQSDENPTDVSDAANLNVPTHKIGDDQKENLHEEQEREHIFEAA